MRASRLIIALLTLSWLSPAELRGLQAAGLPHRLSGIAVSTNGAVIIQVEGSVSNLFTLAGTMASQYLQMFDMYFMNASPDLVQWTREDLLLRTNGASTSWLWQDSNAATGIARFYRTPTNYLITAFPQPTGSYGVGKLTRLLTDSTRTNRYGIPTNGSFMSTIWYPADLPPAGTFPGSYTDSAVAKDGAFYSFFGWTTLWEPVIAGCVAHAYTDVPLVSGTNRFPVILHSHGYSCDRTLNSQISAELASHGYIVAAVDHVDCHATVYPDARGARYVTPWSYPVDLALTQSRTNDLECLLAALAQFDSTDPIFAGRLGLDSIGAMGFSWGGGTVGELCRNDSRVQCAVLLDPAFDAPDNPDLWALGLPKPFLTMNDTVAIHGSFLPTPDEFSNMSSNLFYLAATHATWLKVANASHTTFCDLGWDRDSGPGTRDAALAIAAATRWFFDTWLKGEAPGFPTNPQLVDVEQK